MDKLLPVRLVLVSASPRRLELLSKLELPFDVCPSDAEELLSGADGRALAVLNAQRKVERSSFFEDRSRVLLGADTLIDLDGLFLGKPDGAESARQMLEALSGRTHEVITGVCLSGPWSDPHSPFIRISSAAVSRVRFHSLSPSDLRSYLETREWEGKAGAYAIQGAGRNFVAELDGDFDNVVGLPTTLIHDLLRSHFSHCRFL